MLPKNWRFLFIILFLINYLPLKPTHAQSIVLPLEYLGLTQGKINSCFVYPKEAELKGWEGIVKVKFILGSDGRIKDIDIAESSGYPLLDAAAILAIKDAGPYPFPNEYKTEELELILPVEYLRLSSAFPQPETLPTIEEMPIKLDTELGYFVDLAIKNNEPTKVAQEEIELAQLKVTEAQRNLFPAFKIQAYSTQGQTQEIDYEEKESKFQIDQPLYYSGRLQDTLKQAWVNLKITEKNYDRLKFDVRHKTETAYYTLVASQMHLLQKQVIMKEAEEILQKIENLAKVGMIIPLEVNSTKSWFEQIKFQIKSIEHEVSMAELAFKQVLNLKDIPQATAQSLEAKIVDFDLDTCLAIAYKNRPEKYLSELLVKFNAYGKKIEMDKNQFTVDLVTSYGYYQGHYKTEPWRDSENWYAGIKASKPFGGSTTNTSYTTEKSQPRFGQTSPTESSTLSGEFNLLDNLKVHSDIKKSKIDLRRSLSDLEESYKTIHFEVQDAFLKYKKATLQLNAAESEMKFRRSEIEVIKIRASVGETSYSNTIESLYTYSEAQTRYIQALANYYLSLATFQKACGYGLKI